MYDYLTCPRCDEIAEVHNMMHHESKAAMIVLARCESCDKVLYHAEGEDGQSIKGIMITKALKASPSNFEEDDNADGFI